MDFNFITNKEKEFQ